MLPNQLNHSKTERQDFLGLIPCSNSIRGDFHCMQMSLVMSMRYIFDDDCTNRPFYRYGGHIE